MKRYLIYILSVLTGLSALTSCDHDDGLNDSRQIKVCLGVSDTRAGYSTASDVDDFGMFIYDNVNVKMSTSDHSIWTSPFSILWAQTPTTVWAYAPYDASVDGYTSIAVTALADQTTADNVKASDYLAAYKTVDSRPVDGRLSLELKHAMSKTVVNISLLGDVEGGTISNVVFGKPYTAGVLYLHDTVKGDCVVEADMASTKASVNMFALDSNSYEAIIVPQSDLTPKISFSVTVNDTVIDYTWVAGSELNFEQGKKNTISLVASRLGVTLNGITVSAFDDPESGYDFNDEF